VLVERSGALAGDHRGYSGAIHQRARSGAVPRRCRCECWRPAAGRAESGPGSRRAIPGSARQASRQPAAGSVLVRNRRPRDGRRIALGGAVAAASPSGGAGLAGAWLAGPQRALSKRSWSVGGCSRADPRRRAEIMTISIPSSSAWRSGSVSTRCYVGQENPGASHLRRRPTTAQTLFWLAPDQGLAALQGWPMRPETQLSRRQRPTAGADHLLPAAAGPCGSAACLDGLALGPPSGRGGPF